MYKQICSRCKKESDPIRTDKESPAGWFKVHARLTGTRPPEKDPPPQRTFNTPHVNCGIDLLICDECTKDWVFPRNHEDQQSELLAAFEDWMFDAIADAVANQGG